MLTACSILSSSITCTYFWNNNNPRGDVIALIAFSFWCTLSALDYKSSRRLSKSLFFSSYILFVHLISVLLVAVIYRMSPFHPLASYPGPLINKVTSLKLAHMVFTGKRHLMVAALHKKYGIFVRTGPNTLSINSLDAIGPIYASAQSFNKSEAYRPGRFKGSSLFFIRDRQKHNIRRRVWAGAFTPTILKRGDVLMNRRTQQLISCIYRRRDSTGMVDLALCIKHWAFDVMGDFTFGGASRIELMQDGDTEGIVPCVQRAMVAFEVLGEVPSIFDMMHYLPASRDMHTLQGIASRLLTSRKTSTSKTDIDISSFLLGHHGVQPLNDEDLILDSVLAVEAGSDSSAGVLVLLFYYLLSDEDIYQRLTEELDCRFPSGEIQPEDHLSLPTIPYLNAVINEGLRLGTLLPGLPRVVPKDGAIIANHHIPGGTIVGVPSYAQQTSPDNFWPAPLEFRPERWLPGGLGPDTIVKSDAIMSFSFGPFGCLGKAVAIRQLHLSVAQLVLSFRLSFASSFQRVKFMDGVSNMRTTVFKYPLLIDAEPRIS